MSCLPTTTTTTLDEYPALPTLPTELRDLILETALLHEDRDLWRFMVLSHETSAFLEISLYESVVIETQDKADCFLSNLAILPARCTYVKALCLCYPVEHELGSRILALCPNVRRLAYWCHWGEGEALQDVIASVKKPLLSISGRFIYHPPLLNSPTYQSLQYLEVIDDWFFIRKWDWDFELLADLKDLHFIKLSQSIYGKSLPNPPSSAASFQTEINRCLELGTVETINAMQLVLKDGELEPRMSVGGSGRGDPASSWWSHTVGEERLITHRRSSTDFDS